MRAMNRVFNVGGNRDNQERVWKAKELMATVIPNLSLMVKDHKPLDGEGQPKTRPVCGADRSMNGELSETLSIILDGTAIVLPGKEVISTEELLHKVNELNLALLKGDIKAGEGGLCLGSLDVNALFPNLHIPSCAKICSQRVVESPMTLEGVDYRAGAIYIASCLTQEEVVR